MGELQVRGPWVSTRYHDNDEAKDRWTADGWFRTGDVVTLDATGSIKLADRTKDLVKSGGEWISSVELENALMGHPAVKEAAVVAVAHPRWGERPLATVVLREGKAPTAAELQEWLRSEVPEVLDTRGHRLRRGDPPHLGGQVPEVGAARALRRLDLARYFFQLTRALATSSASKKFFGRLAQRLRPLRGGERLGVLSRGVEQLGLGPDVVPRLLELDGAVHQLHRQRRLDAGAEQVAGGGVVRPPVVSLEGADLRPAPAPGSRCVNFTPTRWVSHSIASVPFSSSKSRMAKARRSRGGMVVAVAGTRRASSLCL